MCLICCQVIRIPKEYNVSRHYPSMQNSYNKCTGVFRIALWKKLKIGLIKQKNV